MTRYKKVRSALFVWWFKTKRLPIKIKNRIWNKYILTWWYRLWIRKNEFHRSLDIDGLAMSEMNREESKTYIADLVRRRNIAHQKGLGMF